MGAPASVRVAASAPPIAWFDVLIVGAGHSGSQVATLLRQHRFDGLIGIIGEEDDHPYERPALSKGYLAREKPFARMTLKQPGFWSDKAIDLRLGRRVVAVDAERRAVTLSTGDVVGYGRLVWAAGGAPRRLACEGSDLKGIHYVRTRADVDRITGELDHAQNVVVIGGGYIGLEAAATLVKTGRSITILEALDRVLARVAGPELSRFYETEHRARGVTVRLGSTVRSIVGDSGRVAAVELDDGTSVKADMVIVGIGIVPEVAPLIDAGAEGGNGVTVDAACRTSLPDVFAVGDCAAHVNAFAGGKSVRLESIQNANDMAAIAARTIAGLEATCATVPWFWSNQYDLRLQTAGLSGGYDECVVRGDVAQRSFSVLYLRDGRLIAVDAVNITADFVQGKALIAISAALDLGRARDPSIPLKDALADDGGDAATTIATLSMRA